MQLNLAQLLGALLTPGYTQGLSVDAGIVTLESGDTFDVKANAQQLQTLLMCASVDLKDAHDQLVQFISNDAQDEPYYKETREQLLAVRQGLEALNLGTGAPAPAAQVETDMKVSLDGGVTFQPAPSGVRIVYENVDVIGEDERGQVHINATSEGIITDVWVSREEHLDHNIGTSNQSIDGIVSDLVEDGA
jgi:hypothetical protein